MRKFDIKDLVAKYGAPNLRIFITRECNRGGFFVDPFSGRKEYVINEEKDDLSKNYKITFDLTGNDRVAFPAGYPAPDWWTGSFNRYRMYICDFDNSSNVEIFVLVDEDNKYQQVV